MLNDLAVFISKTIDSRQGANLEFVVIQDTNMLSALVNELNELRLNWKDQHALDPEVDEIYVRGVRIIDVSKTVKYPC